MNRLQLAEYLTREFLNFESRVVSVEKTENPIECVIVYEDGKRQLCNGLIAAKLLEASDY